MPLYCSRQIIHALADLEYPATKTEVLRQAERADAWEAAIVALNSLPDGATFHDVDEICVNISSACSLELERALRDVVFPASGAELLAHADAKGAGGFVREALGSLETERVYESIGEVCRVAAD